MNIDAESVVYSNDVNELVHLPSLPFKAHCPNNRGLPLKRIVVNGAAQSVLNSANLPIVYGSMDSLNAHSHLFVISPQTPRFPTDTNASIELRAVLLSQTYHRTLRPPHPQAAAVPSS